MNSWRWRAMHWPMTVPSDIERHEQRCRAVADVIVGHRPGPAFLDPGKRPLDPRAVGRTAPQARPSLASFRGCGHAVSFSS
jgi:hypothetical protein